MNCLKHLFKKNSAQEIAVINQNSTFKKIRVSLSWSSSEMRIYLYKTYLDYEGVEMDSFKTLLSWKEMSKVKPSELIPQLEDLLEKLKIYETIEG